MVVVERVGEATDGTRDSGVVWTWRRAVGLEEFVAVFPAGGILMVWARR